MSDDMGASPIGDRAVAASPSSPSVSPLRASIPSASGLLIELVMQDGSIAETRIADNVHNRQLQNYIARHESFALTHARAAKTEQVRA